MTPDEGAATLHTTPEWWANPESSSVVSDRPTVVTPDGSEVPAPATATMTTNNKVRRLAYLKKRVKTATEEIAEYKREIKELDEDIQTEWAEDGVKGLPIDDMVASMFPVFYVKHLSSNGPDDIRDALKESGLDYMLKSNYSASALLRYLKDLDSRGERPPKALAAVCALHVSSEIRIRYVAPRTVPSSR